MSAFSFGATTPAAAPTTPGAPGAAPPTFGGFGSTPPAAPALGGAPAPGGTSLFGNTPAPTATGGLFGSAPAPGGGSLFGGGTPAPSATAPASGFGFGGTTPAPAGGGLFGGTGTPAAPASAFGGGGGGLFGSSTPAPSSTGGFGGGGFGGFGTPVPGPAATSAFGTQQPTAASPFAPQPVPAPTVPAGMAGQAFYSQLAPDQKNVLDEVHKAIMNHGRTLASVSNMAPQLLEKNASSASADAAGGGQNLTLPQQLTNIKNQIEQLNNRITSIQENLIVQREESGKTASMATAYALWPTESLAKRNGVTIERSQSKSLSQEEKKQEDNEKVIQEIFDRARLRVDELQRMPSPYVWDLITEMESRTQQINGQLHSLEKAAAAHTTMKQFEAASSSGNTVEQIVAAVSMQDRVMAKVKDDLARAHFKVDELRRMYSLLETGKNVLQLERERASQRERMLEQRQRMQLIKTLSASTGQGAPATTLSAPTPAPSAFGGLGSTTPATSGFGNFGSTPAPAPSFGGFGSSTPAPAPTGGGLFASTTTSTPAPAPGSSFGFGGAPAAATNPASGGGFGFGAAATPAPAPGGLFSTPAATPGAPAPLFGGASSSAPTAKSKQRSRGGTRRR